MHFINLLPHLIQPVMVLRGFRCCFVYIQAKRKEIQVQKDLVLLVPKYKEIKSAHCAHILSHARIAQNFLFD